MRASLLLTVLVVLCALVAVSSAFGLRRLPQEYQNDMERRHAEVEEMTKKSALLDEVMRKRELALEQQAEIQRHLAEYEDRQAIRKAKTEEFRAIRNEIRADAESRKREREQRIEEAHAKRARMI